MADARRVRADLPHAAGSGAAQCEKLCASARRFTRPAGQSQRRKRTQDWIKPGGNVSMFVIGRLSRSTFRLVSDQVSSAIIAQAESLLADIQGRYLGTLPTDAAATAADGAP